MPRFNANPDALYLTDNGRCLCGAHLGASAQATGRDISGQKIEELGPDDVTAWLAEMVAMRAENPREPECEVCAKKITRPATEWTEHTFRCTSCGWTVRASKEAIAEMRRDNDVEGRTDAEVAASFDFCIECIDGEHYAGEKVSPPPSRVVKDWDAGWRVLWGDRLTAPSFADKGGALAYQDMLNRDRRKPEFSERMADVVLSRMERAGFHLIEKDGGSAFERLDDEGEIQELVTREREATAPQALTDTVSITTNAGCSPSDPTAGSSGIIDGYSLAEVVRALEYPSDEYTLLELRLHNGFGKRSWPRSA